jgi:hypothetical protein
MSEPTKLQKLLPVGVYRLHEDVVNPHGDRRRKYGSWHELPRFKAGLYIVETYDLDDDETRPELLMIRPVRRGAQVPITYHRTPAISLLISKLAEEPPGYERMKAECEYFDADDVLAALVRMGKVTPAQLKTIHELLIEGEDDDG